MKKVLVIFGLTMITFGISIEKSFSEVTTTMQEDEKREKITVEALPEAVSKAWSASPNATSTVKEITKVTKGTDVVFEVSYVDAKGTANVAKYKVDGTEVK